MIFYRSAMSNKPQNLLSSYSSQFRVRAGCVFLSLCLAGCVSSPTDGLDLSSVLPPEPTPAPQAGVRHSGQFPNVNEDPQGETTQMSASEKTQIRSTLAPAQNRTSEAEAKASEAEYLREVAKLRKLAAEQKKKIASQNY